MKAGSIQGEKREDWMNINGSNFQLIDLSLEILEHSQKEHVLHSRSKDDDG